MTPCNPARLLYPWGFSKQEYWSGLPCPPPGESSNLGIEPMPLVCPALAIWLFTIVPPGKLYLRVTTMEMEWGKWDWRGKWVRDQDKVVQNDFLIYPKASGNSLKCFKLRHDLICICASEIKLWRLNWSRLGLGVRNLSQVRCTMPGVATVQVREVTVAWE